MQQPLEPYGGLPPFQAHSDTSRAAALAIIDRYRTLREQVYRYTVAQGDDGVTDDELEVFFSQVSINLTPAVRRRELELMGLVTKTPLRRYTRSGRLAAVYQATDLDYAETVQTYSESHRQASEIDVAIVHDAARIKAAATRREIYRLGFTAGRSRTRRTVA